MAIVQILLSYEAICPNFKELYKVKENFKWNIQLKDSLRWIHLAKKQSLRWKNEINQ